MLNPVPRLSIGCLDEKLFQALIFNVVLSELDQAIESLTSLEKLNLGEDRAGANQFLLS